MTRLGSSLPRAAALALIQFGLGGWVEPGPLYAAEAMFIPVEDEWSESPRHTDSIHFTGDYGITLTVDYADTLGRKGTVKTFHRLSIQRDGFEIISDGQSTKFPLNGRMSKRFGYKPRITMMNCFTLTTSSRIALECTIASKHEDCVGDFVWKFVVQFGSAGECINVTTAQHGGHDCDGKKDLAGFRSTAFRCEKLGP